MNDFFTFIKALIEKVNLTVLLLSVAVGILVFKLWIPDSLWATCAFCLAYPFITGILRFITYQNKEYQTKKYLKEREAKEAKEKREKEEQKRAHLCTIYESFSDDTKKGLIKLYRLPSPKDGFINSRIVDMNNEEHKFIWNAVCTAYSIILSDHRLIKRDSMLNQIVHIDADFYKVLEEKSETFEM